MRKALFKIREKMRRREFILGTNTTFNDACVTELLGDCGFDFIWIDMEHTTITKDSAVQHLIACRASGAASFERIPWNDPVLAKPILDMGADGIIIPQIRSYDEAVAAVAAMKYPPKGVRGWAPVLRLRAGHAGVHDRVRGRPHPLPAPDRAHRRCARY